MKQKLTGRFVDLFLYLMLKRSDSVKIKHVEFRSFVFIQIVRAVTTACLGAGDAAMH